MHDFLGKNLLTIRPLKNFDHNIITIIIFHICGMWELIMIIFFYLCIMWLRCWNNFNHLSDTTQRSENTNCSWKNLVDYCVNRCPRQHLNCYRGDGLTLQLYWISSCRQMNMHENHVRTRWIKKPIWPKPASFWPILLREELDKSLRENAWTRPNTLFFFTK